MRDVRIAGGNWAVFSGRNTMSALLSYDSPCNERSLRPKTMRQALPCIGNHAASATYGTDFGLKMRFIVKFSHKSL